MSGAQVVGLWLLGYPLAIPVFYWFFTKDDCKEARPWVAAGGMALMWPVVALFAVILFPVAIVDGWSEKPPATARRMRRRNKDADRLDKAIARWREKGDQCRVNGLIQKQHDLRNPNVRYP